MTLIAEIDETCDISISFVDELYKDKSQGNELINDQSFTIVEGIMDNPFQHKSPNKMSKTINSENSRYTDSVRRMPRTYRDCSA